MLQICVTKFKKNFSLFFAFSLKKYTLGCDAINGHTNFSKVFPLSSAEGILLAEREILTVSQLLEINDLTGRLTTDENRVLFEELAIFPHLQHKLRLFVRVFHRGPIVDKLVCPVTAASSLFPVEKNLSQIFRRQLRHQLHKKIDMPTSYLTRQRDGLMLPRRDTFLNAYKVLSMSLLPSKTKETTFQILNRTIWTQNKAFKSGMATEATCFRCEEVETMEHLLYGCENYSAKVWAMAGRVLTLSLSRHSGVLSPGLTSPHWRSSSTNHTHQFFSTFLMVPPGRSFSYSFRKSRETSSSAKLSLLSLDAVKNSNPEFKHTFCQ